MSTSPSKNESSRTVHRRHVGALLLVEVLLCVLTFWLSFVLVNEMQYRVSFENGIEATLRRLAVAVDNTDNTSRLYFHVAEELQTLEDAFAEIPRDEDGEPIRYIQTDIPPIPIGEGRNEALPDAEIDTRDVTDTLGKSLTLRERPSHADYAAAYSRALNKFREDLNFEKIKADRYENYLIRHSYAQSSRYRKWSILALAVATLLCIGGFAGCLGGILSCAANNYLERPPRLKSFFILSIRPIVGAIVALLTGYTLMFIASGTVTLDDEVTLFMPVSIYGFAFFMAINPYNSLNAIYNFLRSQTQTFVLIGADSRAEEVTRDPVEP